MSDVIKKARVDGWLRNGLTAVSSWIGVGGVARNVKVTSKIRFQGIRAERPGRIQVGTVIGTKDRSRGFFRAAIPPSISVAGLARKSKLSTRLNCAYLRVFQAGREKIDVKSEYGRFYQGDIGTDLSTGGVGHWLRLGQEVVVYKIKAIFLAEIPLWEEGETTDEIYSKA